MNQELLDKLKEKIDRLASSGRLEEAEIFLFGMNAPSNQAIQYLELKGYATAGILDNNGQNQGKTLLGVEVCAPEILGRPRSKPPRILICSRYYPEMKAQLETMGWREGEHIFKLVELNPAAVITTAGDRFDEEACRLRKQLAVCQGLLEAYAPDVQFLLCPVRANGDIYLCAALAAQLCAFKGWRKAVPVVVGGAGKMIAAMFDLSEVHAVRQEEMEALVGAVRVLGSKKTRMTIVHPETFHYTIFSNMECFKGMNFADFIACGALGLPAGSQPAQPKKSGEHSPERYAPRHTLGKKDVLLAPYANSLPCFPKTFWSTLADRLKKRGYSVYTNSSGQTEPPVDGTKSIFLPFAGILDEVSGSGGFIGMRNGLCEIISSSACPKIILYPEKGMGLGTVMDFYGLKEMGLCKDAVELIYREGGDAGVIEEILKHF